ncbi:MAG: divalent metal cation transporter, partial [Thermoleophilaceae bacterium]|nr:divalent metal cation transporter [Thermoleophilaceae bacterium]
DMRYERVDVIIGAVLTGVIGVFVVVACAATLHENSVKITDARDAAIALEPLAGHLAATLFGVGLIGAAVLAASILPLSTAYSVTETFGSEAALDDSFKQAPLFYVTYAVVMALGVVLVLIPGAPLIAILFLTQALNAVLLLPLLIIVRGLTRDHHLMGEFALSRGESVVTMGTIILLAMCLTALLVLSVT